MRRKRTNGLYKMLLVYLIFSPLTLYAAIEIKPAGVVESIISDVTRLPKHMADTKPVPPEPPQVLKAFYKHMDDLKVVSELNKKKAVVLKYAKQRLDSTSPAIAKDEAGELILALSLVKDERALGTMLELAERFEHDTDVGQQVLLMLRDMPATTPVLAYVDKLIKSNQGNHDLVRSALLYYMATNQGAGMRWAAVYRSPGMSPLVRFAGLSLAASLVRDTRVTGWILGELIKKPAVPAYQQYYLLKGLYASVSEAEFDRLLPRFTVLPAVVKDFQRLRDFNKAKGADKNSLAGFMLVSPHLDQQQAAIKYYLQNHTIMNIWPRLDSRRRLSAIRLSQTLGISILPEPEVVKSHVSHHASATPAFALGMLLVALFGYLYWRRRATNGLNAT